MALRPNMRVYFVHSGFLQLDVSERDRLVQWWTQSSDPFIGPVVGYYGEEFWFKRGNVESIVFVGQEAIDRGEADEVAEKFST